MINVRGSWCKGFMDDQCKGFMHDQCKGFMDDLVVGKADKGKGHNMAS